MTVDLYGVLFVATAIGFAVVYRSIKGLNDDIKWLKSDAEITDKVLYDHVQDLRDIKRRIFDLEGRN